MKLSDADKKQIFLDCADMTYKEIGSKYDLQKFYASPQSLVAALGRIYGEVKRDPSKYGLTLPMVDEVEARKKKRLSEVLAAQPKAEGVVAVLPRNEVETRDLEKLDLDIKGSLLHARQKALGLLHKKLDRISEGDNIDSIRIVELTTAFGTIFDKTQIVSGEATEHVAIMGKIDSNMKPEDMFQAVLQMREANQIDKEKKPKP